MSSSNSNSNSSAWCRLLDEKQAAFNEHGIELPDVVTDEASFRLYFEALCRTLKITRCTTLLVKLRFQRINALASAVDALEQLTPPLNLVALVWGSASVAIKTACQAGVELSHIVELLGELNCTIPPLGADIPRFPYDTSLQTPLYQILAVYMDTLLLIISNINVGHSPVALDRSTSIEDSIREAAQIFRKEGETFKQMMERAVQREAIGAQQYASDSSSYARYPGNENTARFQVLQLLGRGSEGDVHEVREVTTAVVYARKQIQIGGNFSTASKTEEQVRNEVDIMQKLTHPHIVSVLFWLKDPGTCSIFMTPSADLNLGVYLENCSKAGYSGDTWEPIIPWFGCLLSALAFAHKLKITHRDIKPSNILIKDGQVFLADFGEAKDFSQHATSRTSNYLMCGTPVYRAPEVTPGNPRGLPADIFSLGCVFSEMLTVCSGRSLKEYQDWREVPNIEYPCAFRANLKKVREWIRGLEISEKLLDPLSYLIKRMLNEDPQQRHTAQQLWSWLVNDNSDIKFYCHYH